MAKIPFVTGYFEYVEVTAKPEYLHDNVKSRSMGKAKGYPIRSTRWNTERRSST